jgi:dTDP-4-dehydrorhamnose 3,5-epimerase
MMYVPKGFAHGFQTLEDDSMAFYQVSESYARDHCRGVRWNDPQLNLVWPLEVTVVSAQDKGWGDLSGADLSPLKGLIPHRG